MARQIFNREAPDALRRARLRAARQREAIRREGERGRRARERAAALGLGRGVPWRRRGG